MSTKTTLASSEPVTRRRMKWLRRNGELSMMFVPGFLYFLIMAYIPMIGVIIAFKDYDVRAGLFGSEWVGLKNFEFFFVSDTALRFTRNTILYNVGYTITTLMASIVLAILMNQIGRRWVKVHQTVLFLPYFLSWVLVGYIANAFLDHKSGYLNSLLTGIGSQPVDWYFESGYWPAILLLANLWKQIGFTTLILYAGIMGISQDYYEAAKIDGATKFQMARKITIPLLAPLVSILVILAVGNMFKGDFGLHYFVTNNSGLIYSTTDIIDTFVFRALRSIGDVSMAAAVGFIQSVVGLVLVIVTNLAIRKLNEENSLW